MNTRRLLTLSILGTLLTVQHSANAGLVSAGTKDNPCTKENFNAVDGSGNPLCKNGVSGAVTSIEALRTVIPGTRKQASSTDDEQTALVSGKHGLAAGSPGSNSAIWASGNYAEFENTNIGASYEADTNNFLLGYDFMVGSRSVLGAVIGYEDLSTSTFYNGGGNDQDGFTIAPYYGVALTERLTFDMSVGFSSLDNDQNRVDPRTGSILRASYDADRFFAALNLAHTYRFDSNQLGARLGYTFAQEDQDGYRETGGVAGNNSRRTVQDRTIELSQAELGFDVIHHANGFSPYASVAFRKDLDLEDDPNAGGLPGGSIVRSDDDTETELLLGIDFNPQNELTISVEAHKVFSRDQYDKWGAGLSFRMPL